MISSEHNDIAGEVDLEGQQQQQHFNREGSTIHVVAEEEVASLFWVASYFQQFQQVVILSVNVTHDGYGITQPDHVGLVFYMVPAVLTIQEATSNI